MDNLLERYDKTWLADKGPSALVICEHLMPIEGPDGVLFPSSFAPGDGFPGGYNIDNFGDGKNVCLIDSVGSQANRIEPIFSPSEYAGLVPQVVIKAGSKKVNLLAAGHRAGDAIVRCSPLQAELQEAFKAVQKGNYELLAKIAPTSIVFGAWDSRDTQAKLPRLIASTIRAFDVRPLHRSAQYVPATDYVAEGLLEEPEDLRDAEGRVKGKHPFAQRGYVHQPASWSNGGVIATGGIRREASLHLAALRLVAAADNQRTLALRRYILGLALTAFTYPPVGYLRQGCHLVLNPAKPREIKEVYGDGTRKDTLLEHEDALAYAREAATAFVIGPDSEVEFDKELAKKDVTEAGEKKSSKAKPAKAK